MSKHILEINFDEIKYNLYEILAVPNDCSESKIKKAYRKLIIKFHPDKNNIIDEEIYNHLTLANQILTNCDLRSKYDEWLKNCNQNNEFYDLKKNYKSSKDKVFNYESKDEAKLSFHEKNKLLNDKHGYDPNFESKPILSKYKDKQNELGIKFEYEKVKNEKDFNSKFSKKKNEEINCQEIIKSQNEITEFNDSNFGFDYSSVENYDLLYTDDKTQGDNFSSLDNAFLLQPKIEFKEDDIDVKIHEYKKQSKDLSALKSFNKN